MYNTLINVQNMKYIMIMEVRNIVNVNVNGNFQDSLLSNTSVSLFCFFSFIAKIYNIPCGSYFCPAWAITRPLIALGYMRMTVHYYQREYRTTRRLDFNDYVIYEHLWSQFRSTHIISVPVAVADTRGLTCQTKSRKFENAMQNIIN